MEAILVFAIGLSVLILLGAIFALPVEIPPIRRYARQSPTTRNIAIVTSGFLVFAIVLITLTWVQASLTNGLTGLTYPVGYFYPNTTLDNALDRELWIHFLLPPFPSITKFGSLPR